MTIKPVIAPSQKRGGAGSGSATAEGEKKESHQNSVVGSETGTAIGHGQQSRTNVNHSHRNMVVDNHGQSPQRRVDVYDELTRHRRSPHKSSRSKRRDHHNDHHHKRERNHVDKLSNVVSVGGVAKSNSPLSANSSPTVPGVVTSCNSPVNHVSATGNKSPEHLMLGSQSPQNQSSVVTQTATNLLKATEDTYSGYNSGDEHLQPKEGLITPDEWKKRDEQFAKCMADRGYILKSVEEDGACLFRSISLQIYGDEEMHDVIRQHTMDYIYKNREYFSQFVTEDINNYIKRKRRQDSHGNHIEIQAMSEIYSRPVEVYSYKPTPINIFNSEQLNNGYAPLRLSYQRCSHYNAIIDPYNATVGVGLGLAGYKPELQTKEAVRLSEQLEIEQTMFEDKLKTTDWEATNEAIEEQIARESYLQWCRENLQKSRNATATTPSTSATVTSGEAASNTNTSSSKYVAHDSSYVVDEADSKRCSTITTNACITSASSSGSDSCTNLSANPLNTFVTLSPKYLNNLGHLKKDDVNGGFESDDTDMSSASSLTGGSVSPSNSLRGKKSKTRNITPNTATNLRSTKKRRRELTNKSNEEEVNLTSKSPKIEVLRNNIRSSTPDFEQQQPCTSKQSNTPDKQRSNGTANVTTTADKPFSSFYQELLEASYGFGQLTESEMLQQAIQMSTQDYIEDQKRKYLYGP
uniref:ubiquitinyl hydrolase 1 n=1 Tax=Glossina brevipalpis TaxID=37001 RepID=A0A1A9WRI7_9MUSC